MPRTRCATSRASRSLKIRLKLHDSSDDSIENNPTNAAAPGPLEGYGLDKPALRVTLKHAEGKPSSWFEIGKKDGAAYGRRPDDTALLKLDVAKADEVIKAFSEL